MIAWLKAQVWSHKYPRPCKGRRTRLRGMNSSVGLGRIEHDSFCSLDQPNHPRSRLIPIPQPFDPFRPFRSFIYHARRSNMSKNHQAQPFFGLPKRKYSPGTDPVMCPGNIIGHNRPTASFKAVAERRMTIARHFQCRVGRKTMTSPAGMTELFNTK